MLRITRRIPRIAPSSNGFGFGMGLQGSKIRRMSALSSPNHHINNDHELISSHNKLPWIQVWVWNSIPKGFKKYFPEEKQPAGENEGNNAAKEPKNTETSEAAAKGSQKETKEQKKTDPSGAKEEPKVESDAKGSQSKSSSKSKGKARVGGGNSTGGPGNSMNISVGAMAGIAAIIAILLTNNSEKSGVEVTFQDFRNNILPSGQVERIFVENNSNVAKVVMKRTSSSASFPKIAFPGASDKSQGGGHADDGSGAGASGSEEHHDFSFAKDPMAEKQPDDLLNAIGAKRVVFGKNVETDIANNIITCHFSIGTIDSFERKLEEAQTELGIPKAQFIPVVYYTEQHVGTDLLRLMPLGITLAVLAAIMSQAPGPGGQGMRGMFSRMNKTVAKKIQKDKVTTRFADVAGCTEAKKEIMEFVEFLKDSKKFTDLGAKIPKGALLVGPPGTGKTMLARAVAGEADVPFFTVSGSDFIEMFVGMGASRVRDLFNEARENAPSIIFIDEIDAVGRKRGKEGSGSNDERESTLNQLLVEMDGFDDTSTVVVLASTNRVDILDKALTRPGRFDRQVTVEKPDIEGRKEVFEVHLKKLKLDAELKTYSSRLAALTPGFSGADIANICNEAAIIAARDNKKAVGFIEFERAIDRVIGGMESKKIMSPEEKRIVSYHEAGHAVAGWYLQHADPLLKVTIVARSSGALGFAQYLPKELMLRSTDQLLDMICMALAGRASEQVNFGQVTTGASDDLRRVTQIVYQMIQVYGMNKTIGQVGFQKDEGMFAERAYSETTAEMMDLEARELIDKAYARTIALMEEKKEQVRLVAEYLMEKETITNADVTRLIGPRPFSPGQAYLQYVEAGRGWDKETPTTQAGVVDDAATGAADAATFAGEVGNNDTPSTDVGVSSKSSEQGSIESPAGRKHPAGQP